MKFSSRIFGKLSTREKKDQLGGTLKDYFLLSKPKGQYENNDFSWERHIHNSFRFSLVNPNTDKLTNQLKEGTCAWPAKPEKSAGKRVMTGRDWTFSHWLKKASDYSPKPITKHILFTFVLVSMSSRRLDQDSLIWSFHSAIVAASVWPVPISWSHTAFVAATFSDPVLVVSRAKSRNFSISSCWKVNNKWGLFKVIVESQMRALFGETSLIRHTVRME